MRVEQSEHELIIRETPGCLSVFGLFFAFTGGTFIYDSSGGLADYESQSRLMLTPAFVTGGSATVTGIRIIYHAPIIKILINRLENKLLMTRRGLLVERQSIYDLDETERFCLTKERDGDGDQVWYFAIKLGDCEIIKITSLASYSEEYERQYVFQANAFMNKQILSAQMILNAGDEEETEIS